MSYIQENIDRWAQQTYGDAMESRLARGRYGTNPGPEIDMMRKVLRNQRLTDRIMDGDSTSGLANMEREVGNFKYVTVFNAISQASDWAPVDMVYGVCYLATKDPIVHKKAQEWGMSDESLITRMCGRALRALPSYIREHDLRMQLESRIPNARFVQNQQLDTILHADLMMVRDGQEYYFWSFVDTPRSIANFQDKFFGHRQGHVPDGNHVTCPFSLDYCAEVNGWKLYDPLQVSAVARMLDREPNADYGQVVELSEKTPSYFSTPKLISKHEYRIIDGPNFDDGHGGDSPNFDDGPGNR